MSTSELSSSDPEARLGTGAEIEAAELVVAADAGAIRAAADVGEEGPHEVEVGDVVPPGAISSPTKPSLLRRPFSREQAK